MSDYENEPTTSPENSKKEAGGMMDLPPGFAPLAPPPVPSPTPPPRPPSMQPSDLSGAPEAEESVESSAAPSFKPMLARYPMRKPAVKVALLDPKKVYAKKDEGEPIVPHDIVAPVSEGFLEESESSDDKSLANEFSGSSTRIEIEPISVMPDLASPVSETEEVESEEVESEEVESEEVGAEEVGAEEVGAEEVEAEEVEAEEVEAEEVESEEVESEEVESEEVESEAVESEAVESEKVESEEIESEEVEAEEVEAEEVEAEEVEAEEVEAEEVEDLAGGGDLGGREPEIKPLRLEPLTINDSDEKSFDVVELEDSNDSVLDDIELTLDEENAFVADSEDLSAEENEEAKPNIPDPDEVAELVAKKSQSSSEVEVLGPERPKREELSVPEEKVNKWAFWKRPSKRDQQLARISEGYLEMIDLVRAIRGQLESQNENNVILRESLAHLPDAMKGLDQGLARFSKSQQVVGKALGEINTQMKSYNEKDERLAVSMDGFNDTLKGMDDTSKATMKTFDRVQERMRDSDIRMENLFQNVQNTEEKVSDTMVRLQRNMAVMQYIFLGCLMVVIGVLVFTVIMKNDESDNSPRIERAEPKPGPKND